LSKLGLKSWKIGRLENFLIRKFSQKFANFRNVIIPAKKNRKKVTFSKELLYNIYIGLDMHYIREKYLGHQTNFHENFLKYMQKNYRSEYEFIRRPCPYRTKTLTVLLNLVEFFRKARTVQRSVFK
jgi:hypothetical protein